MKSIRKNLLVALLGAMAVVMLFGGWATYSAARNEAGTLFDYHLQQIALSLRDQTFQGPAEALASDESLEFVIRVWDRNGLTVYYSRPQQTLPERDRAEDRRQRHDQRGRHRRVHDCGQQHRPGHGQERDPDRQPAGRRQLGDQPGRERV